LLDFFSFETTKNNKNEQFDC